MSISLKVSNIVTFNVKGSTKTESGSEQPFGFTLKAERLTQSEMLRIIRADEQVVEIMAEKVISWTGVKDGDQHVEYSADLLRLLCENHPGLGIKAFNAYVAACVVNQENKAKN